MVEGVGVQGLEQHIADISFCTARSASEYGAVFELDIVPGMTVLDVGAGGSDFTARLIDWGVDAYAVDPIYKARSQVRGKVEAYGQLLVRSAATVQKRQEFIRRAVLATETVDRFSESVKQNPDHYLADYVLSLSFSDATFDRVYSNNCVTEWMDTQDPMLFLGAIEQMIRVTKPGGKVQLYPFGVRTVPPKDIKLSRSLEDLERGYAMRNLNYAILLKSLSDARILYRTFQGDGESKTLVIEKPNIEVGRSDEAEISIAEGSRTPDSRDENPVS